MTLTFSFGETGLYMFSAFRNSLFRLKEPTLLKRMLHWHVDTLWKSTSVPAVLTDSGKTHWIVGRCFGNNQTMLVCGRLRRWARCIFSEFCWRSCTARSSRILGLATRSGTGRGMSPDLIANRSSVMRCSVRSNGRLLITHTITWQLPLRLIAQAILSLVPSLLFQGTRIYS